MHTLRLVLRVLFLGTNGIIVSAVLNTEVGSVADLGADGQWKFAATALRSTQRRSGSLPGQNRSMPTPARTRSNPLTGFSEFLQSLMGRAVTPKGNVGEDSWPNEIPDLVTVFSTDCTTYHDWQSVVLHQTWQRTRLPGQMVRLLACDPEQQQRYSRFDLLGDSAATHVHDEKKYEAGHDYPPLNKPWGLLSWLTEGGGRKLRNDTVILIVDPDMAFRSERTLEELMPLVRHVHASGTALGLDYKYVRWGMRHHRWQLPLRFLHRSRLWQLQSIGPPILIRKDQLTRFVRQWHDMTLQIVRDPELLSLVHDGAQHAPWIAEMYGYSLAAANELPDLHDSQELWPALQAPQPPWPSTGSTKGVDNPVLLHYSHTFHLCNKVFGKGKYRRIDLLSCSLADHAFESFLRPPEKEQVYSRECKLCLASGDVIGFGDTCLGAGGKRVSLEAWSQVYESLKRWRLEHCATEN